jgi:hypothetical protein
MLCGLVDLFVQEPAASIFRIKELYIHWRWSQKVPPKVGNSLPGHMALYPRRPYCSLFNCGLWGYWHCGHSWPIVPASGDSEDDCGEARLAGETEVLGENLPQRHFCPSQNPTWPDPGLNPGRRGGKPATNSLSYGAAYCSHSLVLECQMLQN